MHNWGKAVRTSIASMMVLGTCFAYSSAPAMANADTTENVQLVCDQKTVGAGHTSSYHILYHNIHIEKLKTVILKIQVPVGLDVEASGDDGGKWDPETRILQWNLTDVEANGVAVIQFHLKAEADDATDTQFKLIAVASEDGQDSSASAPVFIRIGTEIDQPFFVGFPDGKFHPDSSITRAQAAAVVARIEHLSDTAANTTYSDVPSNDWAYKYINEVTNSGYMQGFGDGTFRPDAPLTRAELVTLLLQVRGIETIPIQGFADTDKHWAKDIIGTAKALHYIEGNADNQFDPNGQATRSEAAQLFDIALFRGPLIDGRIQVVQHFPDVPKGSPGFGWIEESAKVAHESVHTLNGEQLLQYLPDQTNPM
ncbi:S-layer homology domain-containing protein [Fodinisporobacter ferrooxydans]|uniref:S-layer homology domain-containing protein n=1 Tax=Fodinisporobacter ferrooxydans TaxID=2901836 RepID=A0ABY4CPI9_9BACL|nr:S-layer homology domain-containing protein [Alicyclobacillaceae bacterium MYW30-H2]